jgi:hypothetical protein
MAAVTWRLAVYWPNVFASETMSLAARRAFAVLPFLVLSACEVTPADKSSQLERVAKDWCLNIRASQILPVYPLTTDLRPGDVFLTMTPIGKEIAQFEAKGFLPFDLHLKRLATDEVLQKFYATRPGEGSAFPTPATAWQTVPPSAFPTYSFEISRGGGLNLAIPVESVPVGFSYLGSAAATGTVSLQRTDTMGLDIATLQPLLAEWERENLGWLAAYGPRPDEARHTPVFVRVVTRVYRAAAVTVALADAASSGFEVAAGLELPTPTPGTPEMSMTAAQQYAALANKLSANLAQQVGGKARVVSVSRRTVAMQEEFAAPMVIGYLAYDCQVLAGGLLSAPVPSFQRLTGAAIATPPVWNSSALVSAWYTADETKRVLRIREWVQANLVPAGGTAPSFVDFLAQPQWDGERRRMLREFGVAP